jgi:RNA polymerase sigma-70 factor (ECF subfamily)
MPTRDDSLTSPTLLGRVALVPTDQEAWSQFVDRYGPKILGWCRAWGLQDADARDLSQTVFAKLHLRLRRFRYDPDRRFRGFLRKLVRDTLRDTMSARRWVVADGSCKVHALLENLEAHNDLADRMEREFDLELLDTARRTVQERVEPKTWEAYPLTAEEGMQGSEAAARLQMPVANVFVAKGRVIKMLQEEVRSLEARTCVSRDP